MKNEENPFRIVSTSSQEDQPLTSRKNDHFQEMPLVSIFLLSLIVIGCLGAELMITHDPTYMYLEHYTNAPNSEFYFGTDTMGRDIFSMIWYGGRISLYIGALATIISTFIAILYGTISGIAKPWIDNVMMRFNDLLLSLPTILMIIFVQAMIGKQTPTAIAVVIGLTSWMSISKIVRTEVRQLRNSEYVLASKSMGGGFFHILRKHLMPHFFAAIMFMVVMNFSSAIVAESTLSFLGIGLPVDIVSWGSMLSLAQNAFLTGAWWIILIPGSFLIVTLLCITNIGNYIRNQMTKKQSNLY